MTQAPTPRGPLGQLIEDAKVANGKQWRVVESESGIPLSSIQAWVSGRSGEPSLRGLLHLARYLKIPPDKLAETALIGYVPPLKERASNGVSSSPAEPPSGTPESFGEGVVREGQVLPDSRRRRGSKRRDGDQDGEAR